MDDHWEPPFAWNLTRTQKPRVLVIKTTHSQKRRRCGSLVTGPFHGTANYICIWGKKLLKNKRNEKHKLVVLFYQNLAK